jgi:large subunit ribosomal protein L18
MKSAAMKQLSRTRRHNRIRAKVAGTSARPRLTIYKSNRYMHAQIIDDSKGMTLVSGSTQVLAKESTKMDGAKMLGAELAKRAKAAGITSVVFDRGGFRYTGRVAAVAQAAREGGLTF